jgi:hypothetical protein
MGNLRLSLATITNKLFLKRSVPNRVGLFYSLTHTIGSNLGMVHNVKPLVHILKLTRRLSRLALASRDTMYYGASTIKNKDAYLIVCTVALVPPTPIPTCPLVHISFGLNDASMYSFTTPPRFDDVLKGRQYAREKLAAAVRIVAHLGLDHNIVRVIF